jgi:hypothetical protein
MPNHLHVLVAFRNTGQPINTIIDNGKRFIAYEIINRLKQQGETKLLHQLNLLVEAKDRERNKKHEVWENSFDWKECRTNRFMKQKLDYMHDNPCRGTMNYLELEDIDLTKPASLLTPSPRQRTNPE